MLQIFSDAGTRDNVASLAVLIFEDWKTYCACLTDVREGISNPTAAEAAALELGLRWVLANYPDCTDICIYTDSLGIGQGLCNYLEDGKAPKSSTWWRLCALCDRFRHVRLFHVPGHQPTLNPNVACDKMCTLLLNHYFQGGESCSQ